MILFASGRTDIPAFYSKWFMNRYNEGYFMVRNPFNDSLVNKIYLKDIDLIEFCSKNPLPIIPYLKDIKKPILFHITITPYKSDIEPNVIDKKKIIEGVKKISDIIGIDNIYIRYDPVFISKKYTLDYHIKAFDKLCKNLNGKVKHIIISFLNDYVNVRKNLATLDIQGFKESDYKKIGLSFSKSAKENNMTVQTCFENRNLIEYGFIKGECLSHELAYNLTGKHYPKWKARKENKCSCVEVVDIGSYNSCLHLCKYCYANFNEEKIKENVSSHNPKSPLLIGELKENDEIKIRQK